MLPESGWYRELTLGETPIRCRNSLVRWLQKFDPWSLLIIPGQPVIENNSMKASQVAFAVKDVSMMYTACQRVQSSTTHSNQRWHFAEGGSIGPFTSTWHITNGTVSLTTGVIGTWSERLAQALNLQGSQEDVYDLISCFIPGQNKFYLTLSLVLWKPKWLEVTRSWAMCNTCTPAFDDHVAHTTEKLDNHRLHLCQTAHHFQQTCHLCSLPPYGIKGQVLCQPFVRQSGCHDHHLRLAVLQG